MIGLSQEEWQGVGSLAIGAGMIPLAAIFFALVVAGHSLTPKEDRSRLGNWLGVFCGGVGTIFVCLTVMTLNRWIDLDPTTTGNHVVGTIARIVGVVALVVSLLAAHVAAPMIVKRIAEGGLR